MLIFITLLNNNIYKIYTNVFELGNKFEFTSQCPDSQGSDWVT